MNLHKAFGLKKADKKRSEAWWWKLVDIFENNSLSLNEQDKAFDDAGVTDEEHAEIMDRSAASFMDEGEGRKMGGYGAEEKPGPPLSRSPASQELGDSARKFLRGMGWSEGKINDTIRDLLHPDTSNSPAHQKLRQQIQTGEGEYLGIGDVNKPNDVFTNEPLNAEGEVPRTIAAGKNITDSMRGRAKAGGQYLSDQGSISDMQTGWPKVQPPTERQFREQPELRNAAALNKIDIYKTFGLKKAKKKERIPNPEGKNMAALINSPNKTDRERAHQILGNKRKKIMGIGGKSNKKQMLQHLDREFKDGGDFQEYVRVRPEPTKPKSDTPAKTPAPTTTKTTPTTVTPKSSIPKLNPPKTTPKKPKEEDSPW